MKIKIYDPAMCCPTGLCGPELDSDLVQMSEAVMALEKQGVEVLRFNLAQQPGEFMANGIVSKLLKKDGPESLPVTLVNGDLFKTGDYPTYEELCKAAGVDPMMTRPVLLT